MKDTEGRIGKLEKVCAEEEKQHKSNAFTVEAQYKVSVFFSCSSNSCWLLLWACK